RLRQQEQVRLRVALELQRSAMRDVRQYLEAIAEVELIDPFAVRRAQAAGEANDDVVQTGGRERCQERPRAALAEEAAGVRDAKAVTGPVLEPGEVVEVAAVRDHAHLAGRVEAAHLVRDRLRDGDDRVR